MLAAMQCEASTSGRALGTLGREVAPVARVNSKLLLRLTAPSESVTSVAGLVSTVGVAFVDGCFNFCRPLCLPLILAALVQRLPRRHFICSASAAAQQATGLADERAVQGMAPPKRVLLMVEPSPFTSVMLPPPLPPAVAVCSWLTAAHIAVATASVALPGVPDPDSTAPCWCSYVCGYMNRYRNTIKFLTEAGVEVMVVTPGKGVTAPGVDFSAACDQPADFHGARVSAALGRVALWAAWAAGRVRLNCVCCGSRPHPCARWCPPSLWAYHGTPRCL